MCLRGCFYFSVRLNGLSLIHHQVHYARYFLDSEDHLNIIHASLSYQSFPNAFFQPSGQVFQTAFTN